MYRTVRKGKGNGWQFLCVAVIADQAAHKRITWTRRRANRGIAQNETESKV